MHLVLVLVGAVLAFAGALLVLYAVPVIDVAAGALFSSGMFAIVGALILFALAAVARGINRIAERLEVQPLSAPAIPPIATVAHEEPPPRPTRAEAPAPPAARPEPSATAPAAPAAPPEPAAPAERGPSVLSAWLKRQASRVQTPAPPAEPAAAPPAAAPPRLADEARLPPASAPIEPPVAAAPPPPPPPSAASPPPAFAPSPAPPPAAPPASPAAAPIPRAVSPAARPAPRLATPATPPEATVYKSGVIDGMAYTLFMDGAIEAELPQGRVRFASVDELQRYLTNRQ